MKISTNSLVKSKISTCLLTNLILFCAASAQADVKLNSLFTNNMVLQRDIPAKVFGKADDGEKLTVTINGQTATSTTTNGQWLVKLKPMKAGGPFEMMVKGKNTVTLQNVMLGDVWVCAGQSNMDYDLGKFLSPKLGDVAKKYAKIIDASVNDKVRIALIAKQFPHTAAEEVKIEDSFSKSWQASSAKITPLTSAVGYVFAKNLSAHLNVPIGLIDSNKGGTAVETWMTNNSKKALGAKVGKSGYNGMIAPLHKFAIKGVIWYQGENNSRTIQSSLAYAKNFKIMITDWRKAWGLGDLPFLYVQLAGYAKTKGTNAPLTWPFLRESQTKALELANTAMALALDKGVEFNIHPHHKIAVSERLVLCARKLAYREGIIYSGPQYKSHEIKGNSVVISFDHAGAGLTAKDTLWDKELVKANVLKGFTICGADKEFVAAYAFVKGDTIVVSAKTVAMPLAVRYAWDGFPRSNFANKEGLPAVPFRTDNFNDTSRVARSK